MKLLIHIGYPKTATTTIQESVFVELHKLGLINYLGWTEKCSEINNSVTNIRRHLFVNDELSIVKDSLVEDKINILSDEDILLNPVLQKNQFGIIVEIEKYLDTILRAFGVNNSDVQFLITIRRQPELMYSSFMQKYRFYSDRKVERNFVEFAHESNSKGTYDFLKLIRLLKKYEPLNINFLLFEDLVNNDGIFLDELYKYINVSTEKLGLKNYRSKKRGSNSEHLSLEQYTMFARLCFGRNYKKKIDERYYMLKSRQYSYEKKLFVKRIRFSTEMFLDNYKDWILEHYKPLNMEFAAHLDSPRMFASLSKYNYI